MRVLCMIIPARYQLVECSITNKNSFDSFPLLAAKFFDDGGENCGHFFTLNKSAVRVQIVFNFLSAPGPRNRAV